MEWFDALEVNAWECFRARNRSELFRKLSGFPQDAEAETVADGLSDDDTTIEEQRHMSTS